MSLSASIKGIRKIMRKDAGIGGDEQRIAQLGWLLFYRIYSDLESQSELIDSSYTSPIPQRLRWVNWADQDRLGKDAPTGDELLELVNNDLFPTLKGLNLDEFDGPARERAALVRAVFEDSSNYMKSGTLLRQVIDRINSDIDFNEAKTRHLFGDIYEGILLELQSAGTAGEYYTPRAVTEFAVRMVDPRLGETVLDPACGTGGFLTGAYEHMKEQVETADDLARLKANIHGVEKKPLPHLLCTTNMMVHGVEVPSGIRHGNTLARPLRDYGPADQVDVIVTNPPFGGTEEDGIEYNFPAEFRTRETADLFLLLVVELLKDGGRAAVVLPDGSLFGDGLKARLKERLLSECDLHTIVRLPPTVFSPYSPVKTNVLFFTKGTPTTKIWYFEHPLPDGYKAYSKTKPIGVDEFLREEAWWHDREESEHAWCVPVDVVKERGYDLDIPNPRAPVGRSADPDGLAEQVLLARQQVETATGSLYSRLESLARTTQRSYLKHFNEILAAPDGVENIRQLLLADAVRGRLLPQVASDGSATDFLNRIADEGLVERSPLLKPRAEVEPLWDLPDSWEWARLKELADFAPGKTPPTKEPRYWADEAGDAWATIADMPPGGVLMSTGRRVTEQARSEVFRRPPLAVGTMLMSFKLTIGKVSRLGVEAYTNEAIIALEPATKELGEYLFRVLPVIAAFGRTRGAIKGDTLNKTSLTNLLIPLPPAGEQARLVEEMDALRELCDRLSAAFDEVADVAERLSDAAISQSLLA